MKAEFLIHDNRVRRPRPGCSVDSLKQAHEVKEAERVFEAMAADLSLLTTALANVEGMDNNVLPNGLPPKPEGLATLKRLLPQSTRARQDYEQQLARHNEAVAAQRKGGTDLNCEVGNVVSTSSDNVHEYDTEMVFDASAAWHGLVHETEIELPRGFTDGTVRTDGAPKILFRHGPPPQDSPRHLAGLDVTTDNGSVTYRLYVNRFVPTEVSQWERRVERREAVFRQDPEKGILTYEATVRPLSGKTYCPYYFSPLSSQDLVESRHKPDWLRV